jgi:hypothetical protein
MARLFNSYERRRVVVRIADYYAAELSLVVLVTLTLRMSPADTALLKNLKIISLSLQTFTEF